MGASEGTNQLAEELEGQLVPERSEVRERIIAAVKHHGEASINQVLTYICNEYQVVYNRRYMIKLLSYMVADKDLKRTERGRYATSIK